MPLNFSAPDLTQHPPRSPRVRIGGFVIFARMLDKCRATLAGLMTDLHIALAPHREDIGPWFDLHDLDDYVTFGGKA